MAPTDEPRDPSSFRLLVAVFLTRRDDNETAMRIIRLMERIPAHRGVFFRKFRNLLRSRLNRRFGCHVSPAARIGRNCRFPHPIGIVIGDGVVIGDDCVIYQGVTLGAREIGEEADQRYPVLEDGVVVYAGAVVIGPIHVGRNARIAANAVVLRDVPAGAAAVGVPAVIRK